MKMGKSTKFLWQFSIATLVITRGYCWFVSCNCHGSQLRRLADSDNLWSVTSKTIGWKNIPIPCSNPHLLQNPSHDSDYYPIMNPTFCIFRIPQHPKKSYPVTFRWSSIGTSYAVARNDLPSDPATQLPLGLQLLQLPPWCRLSGAAMDVFTSQFPIPKLAGWLISWKLPI